LPENKWFESRIIQLAFYALSYVADLGDKHAALYLSITELGSLTLESALNELILSNKLSNPLLEKLDIIASARSDRHVGEILEDVISELDLYGVISKWPDSVQCRANLLRLQEECREFGTSNREAMACGGYYGADIKTFLAWLKGRVERDNSQPDAAVIDEEAVQLMTWHKSKGGEWPIVAVCGMDINTSPRLPTTRVSYGGFDDLNVLLDNALIEIFPDFVARETADNFKKELAAGLRDAAKRVIYVALTRAREKVIIEWPSYQVGKNSGSYWDVLTSSAGLALDDSRMKIRCDAMDCRITVVDAEPQELVPNYVLSEHPLYGRRCVVSQSLPQNLTQEAITPSSMEGTLADKEFSVRIENYGSGLSCELPVTDAARGTLIHRAFELISSHPERANLLSDAVEMSLDAIQTESIASMVASFDEWLHKLVQPQAI
jgi:ATP-dependent exoDNAse (exonuclease V) beta subunit